jgi:hypothetical protein
VTIEDLLAEHGAYGLEKQDALSEFLGEHRWSLDLPAGTVDFGLGRVYPIQLIGSESVADASWLWAWANTASRIPEGLLRSVSELRSFGEREGVQPVVEPELRLETVDAHIFGLVACGITGADAYYLAHHDRGAVLFLISDSGLQELLKPSVLRMNTIFTTFISSWEIRDQQRAFVSYAKAKQCKVHVIGSRVECVNPSGETICGSFGQDRLLVRLSSSVGPHISEGEGGRRTSGCS